jgi:hypothetical protein
MHPEIEKLIDLIIIDGKITEKERDVIIKKAKELGVDADEVIITLDAKLYQKEASQTKVDKDEKHGNRKFCPACGATVKSMEVACVCGHEFNNTQSSSTLVDFQKGLNNIVEEERSKIDRTTQGKGIFANDRLIISEHLAQKATYERQALFITSYPVPNNKEDIMEFLSLSMAEALKPQPNLMGMGAGHKDYPLVTLNNAWHSKANQLIMKGKIVFATEPSILEIINNYDLQLKRIEPNKIMSKINNNLTGVLKMGCVTTILFILLMFIITTYRSCYRMDAYQDKLMKESDSILKRQQEFYNNIPQDSLLKIQEKFLEKIDSIKNN